jgi:hypothetical protein
VLIDFVKFINTKLGRKDICLHMLGLKLSKKTIMKKQDKSFVRTGSEKGLNNFKEKKLISYKDKEN